MGRLLMGAASALAVALAAGGALAQAGGDFSQADAVVERSIPDLQRAMTDGRATSEQLVAAYLARIEAIDRAGPTLRSVIALNPARARRGRARSTPSGARAHVRGPLHGVPILIKDNIETADGTATTAGSLALQDNISLAATRRWSRG